MSAIASGEGAFSANESEMLLVDRMRLNLLERTTSHTDFRPNIIYQRTNEANALKFSRDSLLEEKQKPMATKQASYILFL